MDLASSPLASACARKIPIRPLWLLVVSCATLCAAPAQAWKPKTHIYIANVIREDAKDGKVWIPPFGEFTISPEAREAIDAAPYFRAGAVGPDAFPDMWSGQAFIHPNTQPWLRHLWASAAAQSDPKVWGFLYGYLIHCAGDVFANDWVNSHAGRAFPAVAEIAANPSLLSVVAKHLAIENTLDRRISVTNSTISIPYNFVLEKMLLDPGAQQAGMNPLIQHYVSLYWQKYPHRNDKVDVLGVPTYDAEWYRDLAERLTQWVIANETAAKRSVEQGESYIGALTSELGEWAFRSILDMEGAPSATVGAADAFRALSGAA